MKKSAQAGFGALATAAMVGASLLMAPGAFAAEGTASDTIDAEVKEVITIQTTGDIKFSLLPDGSGARTSSGSHDVTVSTTADGYTLQMRANTGNTDLANVNDPTKKFVAGAGVFGGALQVLGDNEWGFRTGSMPQLNNVASTPYGFAAVTTTDQQLKSYTTPVPGDFVNDTTTVHYAASVNGLPVGLYSSEVLYTATSL